MPKINVEVIQEKLSEPKEGVSEGGVPLLHIEGPCGLRMWVTADQVEGYGAAKADLVARRSAAKAAGQEGG